MHCGQGFLNCNKIVVALSDVLVSLLFHFKESWQHKQGSQVWCAMKSGVIPIHDLILDHDINQMVPILPAVHALTGCDTASKVETKVGPIKLKDSFHLLFSFGKDRLNANMISNAEKFLVHCILKCSSTTISSFDELPVRNHVYHRYVSNLDI